MNEQIENIRKEAERMINAISKHKVTLNIEFKGVKKTPNILASLVCYEFGISSNELIGEKRLRNLVDARCAYTYLAINVLKKYKTEIARELNKDRTSIVYLEQKANDLISINDPITEKIAAIESKLNN